MLLTVFAFYTPVLELDIDGALGRSADGECAGGEDGEVAIVGGGISLDEAGAVGLIVNYHPIPPAVLLFLFGQVDGAAGDVLGFVQLYLHIFRTVGREVEVEAVVAIALVFVLGLEDGLLLAVYGHGLRLELGLRVGFRLVVITRAGGERRAHHHHCCCEGKRPACRFRKEIISFHYC